jgi:hypothetical protein
MRDMVIINGNCHIISGIIELLIISYNFATSVTLAILSILDIINWVILCFILTNETRFSYDIIIIVIIL